MKWRKDDIFTFVQKINFGLLIWVLYAFKCTSLTIFKSYCKNHTHTLTHTCDICILVCVQDSQTVLVPICRWNSSLQVESKQPKEKLYCTIIKYSMCRLPEIITFLEAPYVRKSFPESYNLSFYNLKNFFPFI